MNRLLNTSSITGSTVRADRAPRLARATTRSSTRWSSAVIRARQPGSTTVVALRSAMIAGPVDHVPRLRFVALDQRRVVPAALAEHAHAGRDRRRAARARASCRALLRRVAGADRLHRHRLDDQPPLRHQEGEALPVGGLERGLHLGLRRRRERPARSRCPRSARARGDARRSAPAATPWPLELGRGLGGERVEPQRHGRGWRPTSGCSTAAWRIAVWSARPMP